MDRLGQIQRTILSRFHTQTGLGVLVTATCFFLTSCTIEDWPYYKVSAAGASVTRTLVLSRGNLGELLHFPLVDGAELTATSNCYPRDENGFQHCSLIVTLEVQETMVIAFTEGPFVARAPSEPEILLGADKFRRSHPSCPPNVDQPWCTRERVVVELDYVNRRPLRIQVPPSEVELLVPSVIVNERAIAVPVIRFSYEDSFPYQLVPLFANF
jgi:hypothetical protein